MKSRLFHAAGEQGQPEPHTEGVLVECGRVTTVGDLLLATSRFMLTLRRARAVERERTHFLGWCLMILPLRPSSFAAVRVCPAVTFVVTRAANWMPANTFEAGQRVI